MKTGFYTKSNVSIYFMNGQPRLPRKEKKNSEGHISSENVHQNNLLSFCEQQFSREEFRYIEKAWNIAHSAHKGIKRKTGGDYVWHPINTTVILVKEIGLANDWKAIASALLHDVVEDTEYFHDNKDPDNKKVLDAIHKIDGEFKSEDIANYVLALTKLKRRNRSNPTTENYKDIYVQQLIKFPIAVLVKAADRLHNLRTMPDDREFVKKYIQDTEEYILPCVEYIRIGNGNKIKRLADKATALLEQEIKDLKVKFSIN